MRNVDLATTAWNNAKLRRVSDRAFRVWAVGLMWSGLHESDGRLTGQDLDDICYVHGHPGERAAIVAELVEHRLLEADHEASASWLIHDWSEHQLTRADMEAHRDRMRELGAAGGVRSGQVRRAKRKSKRDTQNTKRSEAHASAASTNSAESASQAESKREADASQDARTSEPDASQNTKRTAKRTRTIPSRPLPSPPLQREREGTGRVGGPGGGTAHPSAAAHGQGAAAAAGRAPIPSPNTSPTTTRRHLSRDQIIKRAELLEPRTIHDAQTAPATDLEAVALDVLARHRANNTTAGLGPLVDPQERARAGEQLRAWRRQHDPTERARADQEAADERAAIEDESRTAQTPTAQDTHGPEPDDAATHGDDLDFDLPDPHHEARA